MVGMFNYCFIRVSDYTLVVVMDFVIGVGRCSVRNVAIGGYYIRAMSL